MKSDDTTWPAEAIIPEVADTLIIRKSPADTLAGQPLTFRRDLQGLRAIAILLVVLGHAGLSTVQGGFIGVDVFFVLSGYLITGLLLRELEKNGRIAFMRFYARRLKRLLPALITMLIVSSGAAVWLLSGVEARAIVIFPVCGDLDKQSLFCFYHSRLFR